MKPQPKPLRDPPMRADEKCAVCGKSLTPVSVREGDPFCSTSCCRAHHLVETSGVAAGRLEPVSL